MYVYIYTYANICIFIEQRFHTILYTHGYGYGESKIYVNIPQTKRRTYFYISLAYWRHMESEILVDTSSANVPFPVSRQTNTWTSADLFIVGKDLNLNCNQNIFSLIEFIWQCRLLYGGHCVQVSNINKH